MNKKHPIRLVVAVALVVVALVALTGCMTTQANSTTDTQNANRDYMSQVNRIMDELTTDLNAFSEAVSKDDIVGMRAQADNAYKVIDQLDSITPPDDLKDIHSEYVKGCADLKDALNGYIDLYTDIDTATEAQPFDYSTYDSQLSKIKQKYNSGISHLENGDKKATEMS